MKKYAVLSAVDKGAFWERLCHLYMKIGDYLDMEKLENRSLKYVKIFLSDKKHQYGQLIDSQLWTEYLSFAICNIDGHAPLNNSKISMIIITSDEDDTRIMPGIILENEKTGAFTDDRCFDRYIGKNIKDVFFKEVYNCIYIDENNPKYDIRKIQASPDILRNSTLKYVDTTGVIIDTGRKQSILISVAGGPGLYNEPNFDDDIKKLAGRLLGTTGMLLKDMGLTINDTDCFTIYLRDLSDYHETEKFMDLAFPNIPHIIVKAEPPRDEHTIIIESTVTK